MKKHVVFWPDNPWVTAVYGILAVFCYTLYRQGIFSMLALVGSCLFIAVILGFNIYLWRVEISDHDVSAPGRFRPVPRVSIPWSEAEVHFVRRWTGTHYIVIRRRNSRHLIRVAELNFSAGTRRELRDVLKRHTA